MIGDTLHIQVPEEGFEPFTTSERANTSTEAGMQRLAVLLTDRILDRVGYKTWFSYSETRDKIFDGILMNIVEYKWYLVVKVTPKPSPPHGGPP